MEDTKVMQGAIIVSPDGKFRDVSFSSRTTKEGEVLKEFETNEEKIAYLSEMGDTKVFQIRDVEGELIVYRISKSDDDIAIQAAKKRNDEILSELRSNKFVDAQMKCISEGLVFAEYAPELAKERAALLVEFNENEAVISAAIA